MIATGSAPQLAGALGLEEAGLNLWGCLERARYDALVPRAWRAARLLPDARSALVVAGGGRALFEAFRASPEARLDADPLDAYTRRVVETAAARMPATARAVFGFEQRGGAFADFVALGRAAGLGAPSRLGLLLHPIYGPWISIRAVVLTALELPGSRELADFAPCGGCPAPCAAACPGGAVGAERFRVAVCIATRRSEPACRRSCSARRACPVGREHAYAIEAEAHHMRHSGALGGAC